MSFESTYHWEKPIHTGVIFGSVLALLISICYFSLISVAAYASLALLLVKKFPTRGTFYRWELFMLGTFSYWELFPLAFSFLIKSKMRSLRRVTCLETIFFGSVAMIELERVSNF